MSPELCASLMRLVSAVGQSLPADIAAFDLVILDEASQSDITALPALLRGKQLLVVGDGKQACCPSPLPPRAASQCVSPTCAFVAESRIEAFKMMLRGRHPYVEQVLPGRSIFDLAQASSSQPHLEPERTCFADTRISLYNHFRCVPSIIAFSNEFFYHSRLQPRRLPPRSLRLDPAVVDVVVRGGVKKGKVNLPEGKAIVDYLLARLGEGGELEHASVGIISLAGVEQVRLLRSLVLDALTDVQLAKHRVVVGDPTSFQVCA
ncbi:MAG: hypothetical protein SGPRY_014186 [Prymnesium sp.]